MRVCPFRLGDAGILRRSIDALQEVYLLINFSEDLLALVMTWLATETDIMLNVQTMSYDRLKETVREDFGFVLGSACLDYTDLMQEVFIR